MVKNTSTQIREFVKNALKLYYDNFQVKLSDNAKKDDVNPTIKLNNDGSVYIYDLGNYDGTSIRNASSLQSIIKDNIVTIIPGVNISTQKEDQQLSISALGYTYNQEKDSFNELNSNIATGSHSHAEGYHTTAINEAEHAEGKYNKSNNGTIHSVGIGSSSQLKNAIEILNDGSIFITGLNTVKSYDGTTITNVSTLQEVINEKLDKSSAAAGLRYEVVQQLPTNPESNVIYLIPSTTSITENVYDEKMYINNTWETIGSTQADLTNYYTKPECDDTFSLVDHAHGNISNSGTITATSEQITTSHSIVVTNADGQVFKTNVTFDDNGDQTQFLNIRGNWVVPTDTKNTVGAHNYDGKLYLVGTPSSGDANHSYINNSVYMQNGNITATAFYQSSDERLKNIKSELSIENCYKLINDCSTIIYSLKTDEKDQNQIGMIAQQVKEIMPEVVQESNGYYAINYSRLSVVALNLIKNLSERIIELEKDHNKLEELIKRVEKLEK